MCILSYLPSGVAPDYEALNNGGLNNPDGHGWAIASPEFDHILMGHSLSIREALGEFMEFRFQYPEGPALFHSRWATHGSVSTENCHPFYVDNDKRTVLAHNGILPTDAHPGKGDDRSDTRILADDLLPQRYARLDNRGTRKRLATWAGKGNKLLVLTVDPKYRRNAYLVNAGAGEWDQDSGIWHSNSGYLYAPTWNHKKWVSAYAKALNEAAEVEEVEDDYDFEIRYNADGQELCPLCKDGVLSQWTRYCSDCSHCGDCYDFYADCQCYSSYLSERQRRGGGALDPKPMTDQHTDAFNLG